jgi:hypothetical protein
VRGTIDLFSLSRGVKPQRWSIHKKEEYEKTSKNIQAAVVSLLLVAG